MSELILYATPIGPLADQCRRYFDRLRSDGLATTAQTYPPHCTLTGFFHRLGDRVAATVAEIDGALAAADVAPDGTFPDGEVVVEELVTDDGWVGLRLTSPRLVELAAALASAHRPRPDEDELRIKDWLHLSLAYDTPDLRAHAALAVEVVDPAADVRWQVGLWERRPDGGWERHTPLSPRQ